MNMPICICSSTISPSSYTMTTALTSFLLTSFLLTSFLLTSFLLLVLATFGRHVSEATSPRLRCPLTCLCKGNYSRALVSCTNSYLTDIPQFPVGTRRIWIKENNITRLRADAFSELHKLTTMRITNNNIQSIDERAFEGLAAIEYLCLFEEVLSSFEIGVFRFFTNLTVLKMGVKLTEVPQREICVLKRLRVLKLVLFQFPAAIFHPCFEELTELRVLSLSFMELRNLSRATFHPLRASLTQLRLISCGLRRLQVDLFNNLSRLVLLDLSRNAISSLQSNIFAPLIQLAQLNIAENKLKVISGELLRPLRYLTQLNIGFNPFVNVTLGEEFLNMTRLRHFTLENVKLRSLNNDTFRHLRHSPIVDIDMSACSLRTISNGAFRPLRNLTVLSLDHNPLSGSVLHDAFYGLRGSPLRELHLGDVNLATFSPILFEGLNDSDITTVVLTGSHIASIKRGVFRNLRNVVKLVLRANKIKIIEDQSFEDLIMLSHLNLDKNSIDVMRSARRLGISPGLSALSMKGNLIKKIHLLGYNNLTSLNLTRNSIRVIVADAFVQTPRIKMLDLSENKIRFIQPGAFDPLPYLRKLLLNRNFIQINDTSLFQVCWAILFWNTKL